MDTSETYIKMCDCEEILGERRTLHGDYISVRGGKVGVYPGVWAIDSVWLPRQDQLQDMLEFEDYDSPLFPFIHFCTSGYGTEKEHQKYLDTFESMEQLWLAFVMKKNYGKGKWDGTNWTK